MQKSIFISLFAAMAISPTLGLTAEANAEIQDTDGNMIGAVRLVDTPSGVVSAIIGLIEVPEGIHGIHLHETGDCSAVDFSSAGGHIAGDASHGILSEDGPHPGDLPNVTVREDGVVQMEIFLPEFDIEEHVFDADGAAFILHSGPDDYESQPSGDAGDRIACGAFRESS